MNVFNTTRFLLAILFLAIHGNLISQDLPSENDHIHSQIILMRPVGDSISGLPTMELIHDTSGVHKTMISLIENSFVREFLDLNQILQTYLFNQGQINQIQPAYLAITGNEGGFPRKGFALILHETVILKHNEYYIDISRNQASRNPAGLMAFTQLYPHEMGHVFLHQLCKEDTVNNNTKTVNMHFFNTTTDFCTAFNEGFAEHLENVSRANEKNEVIKEGIFKDISKIDKESPHFIDGFRNDFLIPSRLGYYKSSMIHWYQRFEDYIRFKWAYDGQVNLKNEKLELPELKDIITYRNSGVSHYSNIQKNLVQKHSTEGVVSAFFTQLSDSDLGNIYQDVEFYRSFISKEKDTISQPAQTFTPLENLFIKYFHVLHHHVIFNNSEASQLNDFVKGYIESFPSEADRVIDIYEQSTQSSFEDVIPPPIWLMTTDYTHRMVVFDPFDAITIPVYTFDINAAEVEDLMTIKGVDRTDANKIVSYREKNGFFNSIEGLVEVEGLSEESIGLIRASAIDQEKLEEIVTTNYPALTLQTFLITPIKALLMKSLLYFMIIFGIIYTQAIRPYKKTTSVLIGGFVRYYLLWLIFILIGLVSMVFAQLSGWIFSISILFFLTTALLISRKRNEVKFRVVLAIVLMYLSILPSILA